MQIANAWTRVLYSTSLYMYSAWNGATMMQQSFCCNCTALWMHHQGTRYLHKHGNGPVYVKQIWHLNANIASTVASISPVLNWGCNNTVGVPRHCNLSRILLLYISCIQKTIECHVVTVTNSSTYGEAAVLEINLSQLRPADCRVLIHLYPIGRASDLCQQVALVTIRHALWD